MEVVIETGHTKVLFKDLKIGDAFVILNDSFDKPFVKIGMETAQPIGSSFEQKMNLTGLVYKAKRVVVEY